MKKPFPILTSLLAILFFATAQLNAGETPDAQQQEKIGFEKTKYGLYNNEIKYTKQDRNATTGYVNVVGANLNLVQQTKNVPAKIGSEFGVEWTATSNIEGLVKVKRIWIFPKPVKTNTGRYINRIESTTNIRANGPGFAGFTFEKEYEIVKGKWIFQLYYNDEMVLEQKFNVK